MPSPIEFTAEDRELLRRLGIAVFRNKVILDAQHAITETELAEVSKQIDGKVPVELVDLWKCSFGGALDYDYEIAFEEHLYTASLRELFYPGSKHYRDLNGWIQHELEMGQEVAEEHGRPVPTRTPYLPFGGFEYLERFYVSLKPSEYGAVLVYAQGIPWKGRLNQDSIGIGASSVAELFDQLMLISDPFDSSSDEYASGKEMAERIHELEAEHPDLAGKLKQLVRASIFDWKSVADSTDYTRPMSAKQSKALRLALEFAVDRNDIGIIERLHQKSAPFNVTLHGTSGVLGYAMTKQAFAIVDRLLEIRVDLGSTPIIHAAKCSDELLLKLIKNGTRFDEEAVFSSAETGAIAGAIALVTSGLVTELGPVERIADTAADRAATHDESAVEVETGKLGSYLTAAQYREQAKSLRDFAVRLRVNK